MALGDFVELFLWPLVALGLVSIAAPLVGAFLVARGTSFHGIALPQVAAFGVATAFAVFPWASALPFAGSSDHGHAHPRLMDEPSRLYLFAFAGLFVFLALWLLERGGPGAEDRTSRVAATFAVASGGTVLAAQLSPLGGIHVDALLGGETLSTGPLDAAILGGALLLVLAGTRLRWRTMTLAGFDPEFASALGVRPARSNRLLHLLTGVVVIAGSLTVGALPMFALLVIPPMSVRRRSPSMGRFLARAPIVGALSAVAGALLAFRFDLSMDAAVVAGSALVGAAAALLWRR